MDMICDTNVAGDTCVDSSDDEVEDDACGIEVENEPLF